MKSATERVQPRARNTHRRAKRKQQARLWRTALATSIAWAAGIVSAHADGPITAHRRGKDEITVRFQPKAGKTAGPVFGVSLFTAASPA